MHSKVTTRLVLLRYLKLNSIGVKNADFKVKFLDPRERQG